MNHALAPVLACLVAQPRRRSDGPPLYLAPMEGLGDRAFRRALVLTVGGVDQACTEFIRIPGVRPPTEAHMVKAACRLTRAAYSSTELDTVPLAAQIMGSNPAFLAAATAHLAGSLGCRRVDLNCGCPANTVTGRGAGSSLLQTPEHLAACVGAMAAAAQAHGAQVSVKLRAGFDDTSLLEENLRAAVDAGAQLVALQPPLAQPESKAKVASAAESLASPTAAAALLARRGPRPRKEQSGRAEPRGHSAPRPSATGRATPR